MTALSRRLFRCKEPGCQRRDPHELDGLHTANGRTWGYTGGRPAWMKGLRARELSRG